MAERIRVDNMDVRIVSNGERIGALVRNSLFRSAQDLNVKLHLRETEFNDYQQAKCDLSVIGYDLSKEGILTPRSIYGLVLMLESADIDAPEVLLAVCKDEVPKEVYEAWVDKLTSAYPMMPFDIEEESRVIDTALQPEILLCV